MSAHAGQSRRQVRIVPSGHGLWFEHQSKDLAEQLPNARLLAPDGIDRFPWFAGGDRIVAEVEEFVTGTRSAPPTTES